MTGPNDNLLADILEVERQILAAQEASLALQREAIDRQRRLFRQTGPLIALFVLVAVGPYIWNLIVYFLNR